MTDVRKFLARLNATTCRFNIGSGGGKPELTPQDIAAAIGMITPGLGRELMCHLWWPDGSRATRERLDEVMSYAQLEEWQRLRTDLEKAQLAHHIAQEAMHRDANVDRRINLQKSEAAIEGARAVMWPRLQPMYATIRVGVLLEMATPNMCTRCGGDGELPTGETVTQCDICSGRGTVAIGDSARGRLLKRDESSYRATWKRPYEWLLALCVDHEAEARRQLARRLGGRGHAGETFVSVL